MKKLLAKLLSYVPTPLPVGVTEFTIWTASIIELSGKFADEDSMNFAIASMIMSLGPQRSHVPKNYFVRSLRKTAANQIAGQVFIDIKEKQKAQAAKSAAQPQTEATVNTATSSGTPG